MKDRRVSLTRNNEAQPNGKTIKVVLRNYVSTIEKDDRLAETQ